MNDKLRAHVDLLFQNAPSLPRVYDFKEELLANLQEKYGDLVAAGADPQDAYDTVVSGIGDTESLIQILASEPQPSSSASVRQQTAQVVSTSAFLYCAALAALIFLRQISATLAWVAFWLIVGVATAQLIYHFMTRPPVSSYPQGSARFMDEEKRKKLKGIFQSSFWLITTALYFIISFMFGNWHISWIIFLIAPVISQIINLFLDGR